MKAFAGPNVTDCHKLAVIWDDGKQQPGRETQKGRERCLCFLAGIEDENGAGQLVQQLVAIERQLNSLEAWLLDTFTVVVLVRANAGSLTTMNLTFSRCSPAVQDWRYNSIRSAPWL